MNNNVKDKIMVKKFWSKKQNGELHTDCNKYDIPTEVEKEIQRVAEILDLTYGSERDVESDDGGCV